MKKTLLLIQLTLFLILSANAQNVWTNEIHYDNVGTDEGEFIEVVLENAGSYNLADFAVTLYNGNSGESYDTKTLDVFTMGDVEGDFSILYYDYPSNGIQNGESDGFAISYQGTLIDGQFLSYEGTLTALDGPASGFTSTDIGVSEINADPGTSLQLSGTGSQYIEFVWQPTAPETKGTLNNNQIFGGFTPDPEPSNYPTDFTATAAGLSITLEWTDATGEQLPSAYLIIGERYIVKDANYEVPVDGIPVADDLDWSDGEVSLNVNYGQEMAIFNDLEGGAQYGFVIYPYTNAGEYIDYKTDGEVPYTSAQIDNIVTINFEDFNDGTLGTWTPYNVIGDQVWGPDEFGGDMFAKMSGFDGGSNINEDWLISPDLWMTNLFDVKFSFISAYNYDGAPLELYISNDYDGSGNPNDFTWTNISSMAQWSDGGWNWVESGNIDISEYFSTPTYLAFKYTSSAEESSTWELDDLFVYAKSSVSIPEQERVTFRFYPNPANKVINLNAEISGHLSIMNLAGQLVLNKSIRKGDNRIDVSFLETGIYALQYVDNENHISVEKLMVR